MTYGTLTFGAILITIAAALLSERAQQILARRRQAETDCLGRRNWKRAAFVRKPPTDLSRLCYCYGFGTEDGPDPQCRLCDGTGRMLVPSPPIVARRPTGPPDFICVDCANGVHSMYQFWTEPKCSCRCHGTAA